MHSRVVICRTETPSFCKSLSCPWNIRNLLTMCRYFLFASALIVLSNEFSTLFENPSAASCITNAINTMHYCAQHDPQANRLLFILTSFRDVVVRQNSPPQGPHLGSQLPQQHPSRSLVNENVDPIGDLFIDHTSAGIPPNVLATALTRSPDPVVGHNSNPSISSPHRLGAIKRPSSSSNNPINGNLAPASSNNQDISADLSPGSITQRNNSLDTFFGLARVSSNSADGNDSLGGDEIDFEQLWQWPNSNSTGLTPSGPGSECFSKPPLSHVVQVREFSKRFLPEQEQFWGKGLPENSRPC